MGSERRLCGPLTSFRRESVGGQAAPDRCLSGAA